MQAKPPLVCHANLLAEWGGVAARERSGSGGLRELGSMWGGGRRVHYVHRSATMSNPKSHPYFNICTSRMDAVNDVVFCASMCLYVAGHVGLTPSRPLRLSSNYEKCSKSRQACKFN